MQRASEARVGVVVGPPSHSQTCVFQRRRQEDTSLYDAGKGCALEWGKERHHEDIFSPLFVVACEKRSGKEDVTCLAHHSRLSGFSPCFEMCQRVSPCLPPISHQKRYR